LHGTVTVLSIKFLFGSSYGRIFYFFEDGEEGGRGGGGGTLGDIHAMSCVNMRASVGMLAIVRAKPEVVVALCFWTGVVVPVPMELLDVTYR
jgi:hypothetical protein